MKKDYRRAKYFGDFQRLNTESKRRKAITRANKIRKRQAEYLESIDNELIRIFEGELCEKT